MKRPTTKNPIISPIQERSKMTFEAIVTATTYFLIHRGFGCFTSNDIAEKAGVNINSFYQYFLNSEAAVLEVANRIVIADEKEFATSVAKAAKMKSVREGFRYILNQMLELMTRDLSLRSQIYVNLPTIVGGIRIQERRHKFAQAVVDFVPDDKFPKKAQRLIVAQVVVHTFLSVIIGFMDSTHEKDEKEMIEQEVLKLILHYAC
jgi:AcrR family transcriptional regulator